MSTLLCVALTCAEDEAMVGNMQDMTGSVCDQYTFNSNQQKYDRA